MKIGKKTEAKIPLQSTKILFLSICIGLFMLSFVSASGFGYDTPTSDSSDVTVLFGNLTLLSQLSDVNIPAPGDNEFLRYDTGTSKWIAEAVAGLSLWDAIFNSSFVSLDSDTSYNATYVAINSTANIQGLLNSTNIYSTYNSTYAGNIDTNETTRLNLINQTIVDSNASWLSTYNTTYNSFILNVSRNWTALTFSTYNSTWDNNWVNVFAYNHTLATYNLWNTDWTSTYNATYVTINSTANIQGLLNSTGIYSTYNSSYALLTDLTTGNVTVTSIVAVKNTAGATADKGAVMAFDGYNSGLDRYDVIFVNNSDSMVHSDCLMLSSTADNGNGQCVLNGAIEGMDTSQWSEGDMLYLNDTAGTLTDIRPPTANCVQMVAEVMEDHGTVGVLRVHGAGRCNGMPNYYSTYNATYDAYAYNVSLNYSEIVFDTWNSTWDNNWVNVWAYNHSLLATLQKVLNDTSIYETYNATYALYNDTTLIEAVNTTSNIQGLLNDTGIYETYNETYDNYALNVSKNYTLRTFNTWNSTWDNRWINTLANLQSVMNASGIYSTYNATYDAYALNVSKNWTEMTFAGYNAPWTTTYNATYDSYVTANYTNKSNYWDDLNIFNATQMEDSGGVLNILVSWLVSLFYTETEVDSLITGINTTLNIQNLLNDTGVYSTYNSTYDSYSLNVSRNWTAMTYSGYDASWTSTYNATYNAKVSFPGWTNVAWINETNTFAENQTMEGIFFENDATNHKIWDNATCIIITGDTSTFNIC